MYRDKPVCVVVSRNEQNIWEPDQTIEAWRGPNEGETFATCSAARDFAARHADRNVTVWSFTLEHGAAPLAQYKNGKVCEDGIAQMSCYLNWLAGPIMQVVAEYLAQQSLILDMKSDPDDTALACAAE